MYIFFSFSVLNSTRMKTFQAYRFSSILRELFLLLKIFSLLLGFVNFDRIRINAPLLSIILPEIH